MAQIVTNCWKMIAVPQSWGWFHCWPPDFLQLCIAKFSASSHLISKLHTLVEVSLWAGRDDRVSLGLERRWERLPGPTAVIYWLRCGTLNKPYGVDQKTLYPYSWLITLFLIIIAWDAWGSDRRHGQTQIHHRVWWLQCFGHQLARGVSPIWIWI